MPGGGNQRDRHRTDWTTIAAGLVAVTFSTAVFSPLLAAYFRKDDFLHLFHLSNYDLLDNLLAQHGGHVQVVRNVVFFLCWRAFDMQPFGYYAVMLIGHALNVALLCGVIHRLTHSAALAAFGATAWGTAPVHAEVIGWYSVFGHALTGTVLLVILFQLAGTARAGRAPRPIDCWTWFLLALAGMTCFGVGIGVALVLPWVVALFCPQRHRWWRPPLSTLPVVVPIVYVVLLRAYEIVWMDANFLSSTVNLAAQTGDRFPLALWHMASYGTARLLCGEWCAGTAATAVTVPISSAITVAVVAGAVWAGLHSARDRRVVLACALIAGASYGMIVVGRGAFVAANPAVLHALPRYHYVALIPVTIGLCIALQRIGRSLHVSAAAATAMFLVWLGVAIAGAVIAPPWLDLAETAREQTLDFVAAVHAAAEAVGPGEPVYMANGPFPPLVLPGPHFPKRAAAFTLYFSGDTVDGRRVYFVEPNQSIRSWNARAVPAGRLLIAPRAVPAGATIH